MVVSPILIKLGHYQISNSPKSLFPNKLEAQILRAPPRGAGDYRLLIISLLLPAIAAGLFLIECAIFHFPASTGLDVLWLAGLTILPGTLIVLILDQYFALSLTAGEILSLGSAIGFGIPSFVLMIIHAVGLPHGTAVFYAIRFSFTAIGLGLILTRKIKLGIGAQIHALNYLWVALLCVLIWLVAYNLQNFHFGPDGSIITHGLFGVDIPFLAGEIHGIQDYGTLRDLHQMALSWHYHDATYQLLALLSRDRTLEDLAFAAPLVGYTLLAFAIFTLLGRFTKRTALAIVGTSAWFLVSSFTGTEQGSYALSPSFVFGSLIFVNVLLALDKWSKEISTRPKMVWSLILLYLFIELSQTKLSTFLALAIACILLGIFIITTSPCPLLGKGGGKSKALTLIGISMVSLAIVMLQTLGKNPLMPGSDFLIGAPLMGYANHLSAILHIPVSALNPVSHGINLHVQSLLIIPYFIFHFARFTILDPRILGSILLLVFFRKPLKNQNSISKEVLYLLLLLIPLGFFLPVLYSPAWYPLALSFYAPLVSIQAAFLVTVVGANIIDSNKTLVFILAPLFSVGLIQNIHFIINEDLSHADMVSPSFRFAMNVLSQQQPDTAIVASYRFNFGIGDTSRDESYYWYSALSGHPVLSEGAKYGSLLAAVADSDREKGLHPIATAESTLYARRAWLDTIYLSRDSGHIREALRIAGIRFAIEDRGIGQHFAIDPRAFGKNIFSNSSCTIWKILSEP